MNYAFCRLTATLLALGWLAVASPMAIAQQAKDTTSSASESGEAAKPRKRRSLSMKDAAESGESITPGRIEFHAENGVYKAVGYFKTWQITKFDYNPEAPEKGSIEIMIDLGSVTAGDKDLTAHLKTKDFFEVEKFPRATVKIDRIQKAGEPDHYTATATLAIKDVTKEYPVAFKLGKPADFVMAEGEVVVKRSDYSIYTPYDPADELSPKDEVKVSFLTSIDKSLVREIPETTSTDKAKSELKEAAEGVEEGAGKARDAIKGFNLNGK